MVMPPGAAMACACVSTFSWVSKTSPSGLVVVRHAPSTERPHSGKRTCRSGAPGTDLEHVCEVGAAVLLPLSNPPKCGVHSHPFLEGERSLAEGIQTDKPAGNHMPSSLHLIQINRRGSTRW